jgi:hypothetical protein
MSDALTTFFKAWGETDADARRALIESVCLDNVTYTDPRSDGRLKGLAAVSDYVGMFSANAPGWTASVVASDAVGDTNRTIVAFGGMGPDGTQMVQHGTYFSVAAHGKLVMIAGFVGTGAIE